MTFLLLLRESVSGFPFRRESRLAGLLSTVVLITSDSARPPLEEYIPAQVSQQIALGACDEASSVFDMRILRVNYVAFPLVRRDEAAHILQKYKEGNA